MKRISSVEFNEMSNLTAGDTGLPFIIWISARPGSEGQVAEVKAERDGILYPMSIDESPEWKIKANVRNPFSPEETESLIKFIRQNKDILLSYRNNQGRMSMRNVLDNIMKVEL